jgi:hypothetical protein
VRGSVRSFLTALFLYPGRQSLNMYPAFGKSNIYFRVRKILRGFFQGLVRRIRSFRLPRPTLGKVWLRLSYFEERLSRLEEDDQKIFITNFYHSVRQVNYMTLLTVLVIIATYLTTWQFRMIGFWEGLAVEAILVFTLFYIVWYYRLGMEDLLDYLLGTETTPDYAFRPRLAPAGYKPQKTASRSVKKRPGRASRKG